MRLGSSDDLEVSGSSERSLETQRAVAQTMEEGTVHGPNCSLLGSAAAKDHRHCGSDAKT